MNERNLSIVRIVVECDRALSAALRVYNDPSCAMFSKGGKEARKQCGLFIIVYVTACFVCRRSASGVQFLFFDHNVIDFRTTNW